MKKVLSLLKSQTLKDTFVISIGLGITSIIGFIYTVILARVLGPGGFGVYSAIAALATIVYSLGDLGISSALINFLPKKLKQSDLIINTSFWIQSVVVAISLIFFVLVMFFHDNVIPRSLPSDILLAGFLVANYIFIGFAQGVFTAKRQFWSFSLSQIVDSSIKLVIVFVIFKLGQLSISSAIAANVISTLIALFITYGKEIVKMKPTFSTSIAHEIFTFAKWIALSRLFSVLIGRIDIILLNLLATSFATGIYSAANRVSLLFALMVSGLGSVINSRFSAFDTNEKVVSYIKKLLLFIAGISLTMIVAVVLADPIISMVYGPDYILAVPVFQFMTVAMIPFLFTLVTTPAIIYTYNRPDLYAKLTAIQVGLIIIIDIIAIPYFSYFAPVIALAFTNILVLIISGLMLKSLVHGNKILDQG